jgi:hypothetical protein
MSVSSKLTLKYIYNQNTCGSVRQNTPQSSAGIKIQKRCIGNFQETVSRDFGLLFFFI